MLEKSGNFAHASELVKISVLYGFSEVGVAKWLNSATYKYSAECASSYVSRTCTKMVHSCNLTIPTKKSLGTKSETKQEVGYFEFSRHILYNFCHFQVSYFNELLPEIFPDEHQNWSLQSKALCDVKLRRSRVFIGGRCPWRPVKF